MATYLAVASRIQTILYAVITPHRTSLVPPRGGSHNLDPNVHSSMHDVRHALPVSLLAY